MKLKDALKIIADHKKLMNKPTGYLISFERRKRGFLLSDHFPDKHAGEPLIKTEAEAWDIAQQFNESTDNDILNIYVN